MISPNDIRNKRFEKSMKGYKAEAVDAYLNQIADDMASLIEENSSLEQKMNILAEKIEEYRSDEDSLRDALLGAQKLGATVIREAKTKADSIVKEAALKAERINMENIKQVEREKNALVKMQREVTAFRSKLMSIYKQHLELINQLPVFEEPVKPKESEREETLQDVKEFVENGHISRQTEETAPAKTEESAKETKEQDKLGDTIKFSINQENASEAKAAGANENTEEQSKENVSVPSKNANESRFGPLRFGEAYEIKRDAK